MVLAALRLSRDKRHRRNGRHIGADLQCSGLCSTAWAMPADESQRSCGTWTGLPSASSVTVVVPSPVHSTSVIPPACAAGMVPGVRQENTTNNSTCTARISAVVLACRGGIYEPMRAFYQGRRNAPAQNPPAS